jgi:uncharacterized membrane protein YhaH (DUF805 family)
MGNFLSFAGRMGRLRYLVVLIVLQVAVSLLYLPTLNELGMPTASSYIVSMLSMVAYAIPVVRRLHDLDRPGTHYWLLLVPFYNIYLSFVLHFQKGTPGQNAYGPDPLAAQKPSLATS